MNPHLSNNGDAIPECRRNALDIGRLLGALSAALLIVLHASVGVARPGMGAILVAATGRVAPGGLVIDYAPALKRKSVPPVEWDGARSLLTVHGSKEHTIAFAPWEMKDAVRIARITPSGHLEVSVDRIGSDEHFYASPELYPTLAAMQNGTPGPMGTWMQQGDLQFADIVQGPGLVDARLGVSVSPMRIELEMLRNDPKYQVLTRDLVSTPSSWPTIYLSVSDLNAATPVKWRPDYQLRYYTPNLQVVEPEQGNNYIDSEMVRQSDRPYQPLRKWVTGDDPALRDAILREYPALEASVRYAFALASVQATCLKSPAQCGEWQAMAGAVPHDPPPAPEVSQASSKQLREFQDALSEAWSSARLQQAMLEPRRDYRCWIFVDEVMYSAAAGLRYTAQQVEQFLPGRPCDSGELPAIVPLHESLLQLMSFPGAKLSHTALNAFATQVDALSADPHLGSNRAKFWKETVGIEAIRVSGRIKDKDIQEKLWSIGGAEIDACRESLIDSANLAITSPWAKGSLDWRKQLGQADRCYVDAMGATGRQIQAAFHFAIGWAAANNGKREDARNRLRLLDSMAYMARGDANVSNLVRSLASRLATRLGG